MTDIKRFNLFNQFQLAFPIHNKSIRVTAEHLAGIDVNTGIGTIGNDGVLTLSDPIDGVIVYKAFNAIQDIQLNES